jgi:hypothetical protein
MTRILCGFVLVFAVAAFGQLTPPGPPNSTPPTFPQTRQPEQTMPPDTAAPLEQEMSSAEVQLKIQDALRAEPQLNGAKVNAAADDRSVVLSGTVNSEDQHQFAVRIAESYAGSRHVVDKIVVKQPV